MKLLLDLNLPKSLVSTLRACGYECERWSELGDPRAPDIEIMRFARKHGWTIVTHDLDFGTLLAATTADGPSVIQIRARAPGTEAFAAAIAGALSTFTEELTAGAFVSIDQDRLRVRVLPLRRDVP